MTDIEGVYEDVTVQSIEHINQKDIILTYG